MNTQGLEVVLASLQLTKEICLENVAILDVGYNLNPDGSLPSDHFCTYLRISGSGGMNSYTTFTDTSGFGLSATVEQFMEFKKSLN